MGDGENEYIKIKLPNRRKIYAVDINSSDTTFRLWGSNAISPSDDVLSDYSFDFNDYSSLTGATVESDTIVGTGTWISDPIYLGASWIDSITYRHVGDGCSIFYRTSHDGLNWTDWNKSAYSIDGVSDLSTTFSGTYSIDATSILTEDASEMGQRTFRHVSGASVSVFGNTDFDGFYRYKVEYSPKHKTGSTSTILSWTETPQTSVLATWDTTALDDGPYTIIVTYEDDGGNTFSDSILLYVDNTSPTVSIQSPTSGTNVGEILEITYSVNDDYLQMYRIDIEGETHYRGTENYSGTMSIDISDVSDGLITAQIIAVDKAGNSTTVDVDITKDSEAIVITGVSVDKDILRDTGNLIIEYTLSDDDTVVLTLYDDEDNEIGEINSAAKTAGTIQYEWNGEISGERVEDGNYYIKIETTDTHVYTNVFETYDSAIVATITSPTDSSTVGFVVPIVGSSTDEYFDYYTLEYYDDSTWTIFHIGYSEVDSNFLGFLATNNLGTSIQIRLSVYDTSGNSATDLISLSIRNSKPSIGIAMKKASTYSIDATSVLVGIYTIDATSHLGGSTYSIDATSTLKGAYYIDATSELLDYNTVNLGQLDLRDYIQIKIVLDNTTVSSAAIQYSDDYFALTPEVSNDGQNRINFGPTQTDYLYIHFTEANPVIYELNELFTIECKQEEV
jgi:hypothetical protein